MRFPWQKRAEDDNDATVKRQQKDDDEAERRRVMAEIVRAQRRLIKLETKIRGMRH